MNNKIFWFRVTYIIILVVLTLCYIFIDREIFWSDWISGVAYGMAISGLIGTFDKKRRG